MQVKISKIVYPGRSLSVHDGKVIFCDEGIPGETVDIEPTKDKKNYIEAKTVNIVTSSPHRVKPRCGHYKTCSIYQYIDYEEQVAIKKGQLSELFLRALKINLESLTFERCEKIWGYRNRIHLRVIFENNSACFSYHVPHSFNTYSKIDQCLLASTGINSFLETLRQTLTKLQLNSIIEIEVKESSKTFGLLLVLYLANNLAIEEIKEKLCSHLTSCNVTGIVAVFKDRDRYVQETIFGKDYIEETIEGIDFPIGALSFFQVNIEMLKKLARDIKKELPFHGKETIVDLYCGVGTFGSILAKSAKHVFGVEGSSDNIPYLKAAITRNNIANFDFFHEESSRWLENAKVPQPITLIVDPPRSGLGDSISKLINNIDADRICYVSCDPSTLVRDLKILLTSYTLKKVIAYDFFPHTPHIEVVTILEKKHQPSRQVV